MVNESNPSVESPTLEQQLEATKRELLRTQVRLHSLQETSVAEPAFLQLRSRYFQSEYELWLIKACVAWARSDRTRMAECLESSLECTVLETQSVIADWLKRLDQFAREENLLRPSKLDLETLVSSTEWQALTKRAIAEK